RVNGRMVCQQAVAVRGDVGEIGERLKLGLFPTRIVDRRTLLARLLPDAERSDSPLRQLIPEIVLPALLRVQTGAIFRLIEDIHDGRKGAVSFRDQQVGGRSAVGRDLHLHFMAGKVLDPFCVKIGDSRVIEQGRPGAEPLLPVLQYLLTACLPVGGRGHGTPILEAQNGAIGSEIVPKRCGRLEERRDLAPGGLRRLLSLPSRFFPLAHPSASSVARCVGSFLSWPGSSCLSGQNCPPPCPSPHEQGEGTMVQASASDSPSPTLRERGWG